MPAEVQPCQAFHLVSKSFPARLPPRGRGGEANGDFAPNGQPAAPACVGGRGEGGSSRKQARMLLKGLGGPEAGDLERKALGKRDCSSLPLCLAFPLPQVQTGGQRGGWRSGEGPPGLGESLGPSGSAAQAWMPLQDQGVFGEPLGEGSSEHCNLLFVWGVLQLCEVVTVSQLEKLRSNHRTCPCSPCRPGAEQGLQIPRPDLETAGTAGTLQLLPRKLRRARRKGLRGEEPRAPCAFESPSYGSPGKGSQQVELRPGFLSP